MELSDKYHLLDSDFSKKNSFIFSLKMLKSLKSSFMSNMRRLEDISRINHEYLMRLRQDYDFPQN